MVAETIHQSTAAWRRPATVRADWQQEGRPADSAGAAVSQALKTCERTSAWRTTFATACARGSVGSEFASCVTAIHACSPSPLDPCPAGEAGKFHPQPHAIPGQPSAFTGGCRILQTWCTATCRQRSQGFVELATSPSFESVTHRIIMQLCTWAAALCAKHGWPGSRRGAHGEKQPRAFEIWQLRNSWAKSCHSSQTRDSAQVRTYSSWPMGTPKTINPDLSLCQSSGPSCLWGGISHHTRERHAGAATSWSGL